MIGSGVKVAIFDEGHVAKDHPSFTGRLTFDSVQDGMAYMAGDHATHVAGTIAASGAYIWQNPDFVAALSTSNPAPADVAGLSSLRFEAAEPTALATSAGSPAVKLEKAYPGIATGANLLSYHFADAQNNVAAYDKLAEIIPATPGAIDLVNNSWGEPGLDTACGDFSDYVYQARSFDELISGYLWDVGADGNLVIKQIRRVPVVFATGIGGSPKPCGGIQYRTISPPATGKNVISVGAIDADTHSVASFSDRSTLDRRIKPEVVAPAAEPLLRARLASFPPFPRPRYTQGFVGRLKRHPWSPA